MADFKINLFKKEKQIDPRVFLWKKRIYLILAMVSIFFLIWATGLFFVNNRLLAKAKDFQNQYNMLYQAIEAKKETEGLYLSLIDRLNTLSAIQKNSQLLDVLPKVIDSLIKEGITMQGFTIAGGNKIRLELIAESAQALEKLLDNFVSYKGDFFSFSSPVVERTSMNPEGKYSVSLNFVFKNK